MKEQLAGLAIWLLAGLQFWFWTEARQKRRPRARNHLIAGVLLGIGGLILLFAGPA
ncbi:MAG: hypothetical protein AB1776_01050 [Bacillota bacterium]